MAVTAKDLPDILEERDSSQRALDRWGGLYTTYSQWHTDNRTTYERYGGNWPTYYPDGKSGLDKPIVPDFIRLAVEARARGVAASRPALVCHPPKLGDAAKTAADKRERIISHYWDNSRVMQIMSRWAFDAMMTGLMACEVWPDFDSPAGERFPVYKRVEPNHIFPDPVFTQGPWLDSCIVAYSVSSRTIAAEYGKTLRTQKGTDRATVIKYYDPEQVIIVAEFNDRTRTKQHETLVDVKHSCGKTPIVIGTRATADGLYRGEFDNAQGILEHWNRLETLSLDEAIHAVYPVTVTYDVNETDRQVGPGAEIQLESRDGRYEHVQRPNQPFTNQQKTRDYAGFVRAATIFPPSLSGDPNESVISAAGINASGAQHLQDIASVQTDIIAPMLQAANELALKQDVEYAGDVTKVIFGGSSKHRETYNPTKDIGDDYRNEVVYGALSGLDPINRGVMALQQWQGGLWSKRMAMEMDPNIQDAGRVMKEQVVEKLTEAGIAGLQQAAMQGQLPSDVWAKIMRAIKEDDYSLEQAIEEFMVNAPLAEPAGQPGQPGATPGAPGIPGAAEGGAQPTAPTGPSMPLAELMGV